MGLKEYGTDGNSPIGDMIMNDSHSIALVEKGDIDFDRIEEDVKESFKNIVHQKSLKKEIRDNIRTVSRYSELKWENTVSSEKVINNVWNLRKENFLSSYLHLYITDNDLWIFSNYHNEINVLIVAPYVKNKSDDDREEIKLKNEPPVDENNVYDNILDVFNEELVKKRLKGCTVEESSDGLR